jgi:hypothetical protein
MNGGRPPLEDLLFEKEAEGLSLFLPERQAHEFVQLGMPATTGSQ